jgi:hypothetical protein
VLDDRVLDPRSDRRVVDRVTAADHANTPPERASLNKIERLIRKAERDSRLLDGREFRMRPYAEAHRLIDLWRDYLDAREPE